MIGENFVRAFLMYSLIAAGFVNLHARWRVAEKASKLGITVRGMWYFYIDTADPRCTVEMKNIYFITRVASVVIAAALIVVILA